MCEIRSGQSDNVSHFRDACVDSKAETHGRRRSLRDRSLREECDQRDNCREAMLSEQTHHKVSHSDVRRLNLITQSARWKALCSDAHLRPTLLRIQTMLMVLPVPRFTIDMLDDFPDDGNRYELLEGILLVTPAPAWDHQVIATRLAVMLANAVGADAQVVAVGAIQCRKNTQLQPDILVVPPGYGPKANWRQIHGW